MPFRVIPPAIEIGTFYSGAHVQVESMAGRDSRVVVVVRGGERDEQFYRKVRVGPIWVSGSKVDISGVPALFYRFSSGALRTFLQREAIDQYQLDEASIRSQMRIEPDRDRDQIVSSWLKLKAAEGEYALDRRALSRGLNGQPLSLFVADFAWPKRVPAAVYQITVYECQGGSVVRYAEQSFQVIRVGFPAWLASLANERAVLYGIGSALVASLLGFGIDWLIALSLRKRRL